MRFKESLLKIQQCYTIFLDSVHAFSHVGPRTHKLVNEKSAVVLSTYISTKDLLNLVHSGDEIFLRP